jgi:hypothetical protein
VSGWIAHAFFWLTGARNESGTAYGLMSGIGGSVPDVMIPVAMAGWWWRGTCHHSWRCLRWGKYPAAGGTFRLCRVHHPDLAGQKPHRELIARLHREHQERR